MPPPGSLAHQSLLQAWLISKLPCGWLLSCRHYIIPSHTKMVSLTFPPDAKWTPRKVGAHGMSLGKRRLGPHGAERAWPGLQDQVEELVVLWAVDLRRLVKSRRMQTPNHIGIMDLDVE